MYVKHTSSCDVVVIYLYKYSRTFRNTCVLRIGHHLGIMKVSLHEGYFELHYV